MPVAAAPCTPPALPPGVPDPAGARSAAERLWSAVGYDLRGWDITVDGDGWARRVTATPQLDGMPAPFPLTVTFGEHGRVEDASGFFATFARAGDLPRVGTAAGFARLQRGDVQWGGGWPGGIRRMQAGAVGASGVATPASGVVVPAAAATGGGVNGAEAAGGAATRAPASGGAVDKGADGSGRASDQGTATVSATPAPPPASKTAPASAAPARGPAPSDAGSAPSTASVSTRPMPPDTIPVITVVITSVQPALSLVEAADHTAWLLPAYEFVAKDGGRYTVLALADDAITTPTVQPPASTPTNPVPPASPPTNPVSPSATSGTVAPPGSATPPITPSVPRPSVAPGPPVTKPGPLTSEPGPLPGPDQRPPDATPGTVPRSSVPPPAPSTSEAELTAPPTT
jgi:hypothetical protein